MIWIYVQYIKKIRFLQNEYDIRGIIFGRTGYMTKPETSQLLKVITGEKTQIPEWQRTSFFDKKNKNIFIPAIEADIMNAKKMNEAGHILHYQSHSYLSLKLLQKLHPDQDFSEVEQRILAIVENS